MNIAYNTKKSIVLGDYLDLLFMQDNLDWGKRDGVNDRAWYERTRFERYEKIRNPAEDDSLVAYDPGDKEQQTFPGGILLSYMDDGSKDTPGSGNILITGQPGVGKSTLAFQIAAACASGINKGIAVYYSLEETREHLKKAMCLPSGPASGDDPYPHTRIMNILPDMSSVPATEELCGLLVEALENDDGEIKPQIFFPALSPRGIKADEEANKELFWTRYRQLEYMMKAIKKYNSEDNKNGGKYIKAVIIDSLDVFGEELLNREETYRIFSLFKKYGILGIFTAESHDGDEDNISFAEYIADVVVSLEYDEYNNYFCRYFEITKSRYVKQVNGKHPYKIISCGDLGRVDEDDTVRLKKKIAVYPSLHYLIHATENKENLRKNHTVQGGAESGATRNIFGIKKIDRILPAHFEKRGNTPQVITIVGEGGLYKSDLAVNALINDILEGKNALILQLSDRSSFSINGCRLSEELAEKLIQKKMSIEEDNEKLVELTKQDRREQIHKYATEIYKFPLKKAPKDKGLLIEMVFKSGALLPEEFSSQVCGIISDYDIERVALIDVRSIGISYPFLVNSRTSGDMFLPAFIHLMRNLRVDLIMTCTRNKVKESNRHIYKACELADAILTCGYSRDPNDQTVYISGEGAVTDMNRYSISLKKDAEKWCFRIDNGQTTVSLIPFMIDKVTGPCAAAGLRP